MNSFADRLKELRKQHGFSQVQLSELVGIHSNHISRYERGSSLPKAEILSKLADVLDVSTDYLLEGEHQSALIVDFEDKALLQHFLDVQQLDYKDQVLVKEFLGAFLVKKKLQALVG